MNSLPFFRLFRSPAVKAVVGVVTIATAGIGFVSDILGLRSSDEAEPTVVTVLVTVEPSSEQTLSRDDEESVPTTTIAVDDPIAALEVLRTNLAARASSGVLDVCGKQAMLLTATGLRLFEWQEGTGWSDFSALVTPPTSLIPVGMVVVDAPRDGVPDLLVTFERTGTDPPLSGVLGVPNTSIGCGQGYSWQFFSRADGSFAQLVPNLEPAAGDLVSRDLASTTSPSRYRWNQERQYFQFQSDNVSPVTQTGSAVEPAIVQNFITEYGKFTTASFTNMLQLVETGSPAEQLVKFLLSGKIAGRDAGYGEGSGFVVEEVGGDWRILFPGPATVVSDFTGENGKIRSFRMNEIELANLIRFDDSNPLASRQCTASGVCVGIRGVQLGNRTTYVALEIDTSAAVVRAKFSGSSLTTGANQQRHLSSTNAVVNSPRVSIWSLAYELAELPWGATLEVQLSVNGVTERVTLRVPS